jgi:hypothetical protein
MNFPSIDNVIKSMAYTIKQRIKEMSISAPAETKTKQEIHP